MITAFLAVHLVAAVLAPTLVRHLGSRAFYFLAAAPALTAVWTLSLRPEEGAAYRQATAWVPDLGMTLTFRMDVLAWVMTLIVSVVGTLILLYCAHYFHGDRKGNLGLLAAALVGFAGAMLGLVTTDDMLVLYIFWEITTVLSYLLVGYLTRSAASTRAAKQALIVTAAGGLTMLIGIVMLGQAAGTYSITALIATRPTGPDVEWGIALLLVGAITKSAQVPFHFWLPGAMAAPTPVSAYLHAAAMVKAGIYLVARFAPGFAHLPAWQWMLLGLGSLTMLVGAVRATRQIDLKLILAYGTVSQLGFLMILLAYGSPGATLAGITLVVAHSLFKAALFLTTGAIDHAAGTRDIRKLRYVRRRAPLLAVAGVLAAMSMAGLPVMVGFVGKEAALGALLYPSDGWLSLQGASAAAVVLGSVMTMAYSLRFVWGAFTDASRPPADEHEELVEEDPEWHHPSWMLVGIPLLLAVGGLVLGLFTLPWEALVEPYTASVTHVEDAHTVHLGLWHGITAPLLVSVGVWLVGGTWWWLQSRRPVQVAVPIVPVDAGRVYHQTVRALDRTALEVTGFMQRGSLPVLLGIILVVLIVLPGSQLLFGGIEWPETYRAFDDPAQLLVGGVTVAAALLATRARRRLRAVFLVGVTGYGVALLFLLHGAPDIALTQVLVETVSLVVLVLVLRRLSGRFPDDPTTTTRRIRAAIGVGVGAVVGTTALVAFSSRVHEPAAIGLPERSVDYGAGYNMVNVILVDVRAWDTMGELSVVLACATGVASLIFLSDDVMTRVRDGVRSVRGVRGEMRTTRGMTSEASGESRWLSFVEQVDPARRSTILEVVTRLIFHAVILWSVYLLLAGHDKPGGGFAAGLVAGLALCLRYLAGRGYELRAALPVMPAALLGTGLFIAAGSALLPMFFGSAALRTWYFYLEIPLVGEFKIVTSLLFDVGVYLVVIGLMLDILRSLGSGIDGQVRREADAAVAAEEERR